MRLRNLLYASALSAILLFTGCNKGDAPTEPPKNNRPVITETRADPENPFTEQRVRLECIASDEDNDPLDYIWYSSVGSFDKVNEAIVNWTSPSEPGEYRVTVGVDDNKGGHGNDRLDLRVISRFDTLYVVEDAYIDEYYPNFNSQNDTIFNNFLEVFEDSLGRIESYLKFDFNLERNIRSAKLRLTLIPFEDIFEEDNQNLNIDINEANESWSASTIIWNNRPAYDITPIKRFTAPLFSRDPVTFYVNGMEDLVNNPSQHYGLAFVPVQWNIIKIFYSREGAEKEGETDFIPALILEYE